MIETRFKKTDIGEVPEDWDIKMLGEIAPLQRGFDLPTSTLQNGVVPVIYSNGICNFHNRGICKAPGLVTGRSGTIGKFTFLSSGYYWPHNTTLWVTSFNNNSPLFVYYLYSFQKIEEFSSGSGVPTLNRNDVHKKRIPVPPFIEQQRIATVLSDIDVLLSTLNKKIEKKKLIKQGVMQQLLTGKKRLNGFTESWIEEKLGNISLIKTGCRNGNEAVENGKYPFFVRSQTVYRINSYSFDGEAIIIPGEGGIGSIYHYINGRFDYHQRVYKISDFPKNIYAKYIYFYMKQNFGDYATNLSVKATVDSLRLSAFSNFVLYMPPSKAEQIAIATILSDMDAEIEALETKRAKYEQVKQGMMQQLLTGKIRLID